MGGILEIAAASSIPMAVLAASPQVGFDIIELGLSSKRAITSRS